jgi:ribosomal protein L40E
MQHLVILIITMTVTIMLVLSPHPSILITLVRHYLVLQPSLTLFLTHLGTLYTLTFIILCSLIICISRDPGPVGFEEAINSDNARRSDDMSLAEALMAPSDEPDFNSPAKWCKTCWAPKPERTHHCRHCGRCVLRMGVSSHLWSSRVS